MGHKKPTRPEPEEFASPGGKEMWAMLIDLTYKMGRVEGGFAIIIVLVLAILAIVVEGRING